MLDQLEILLQRWPLLPLNGQKAHQPVTWTAWNSGIKYQFIFILFTIYVLIFLTC